MSKVNKAEPINHFHYYDIHSFNKNEPQVFLGWGGGGGVPCERCEDVGFDSLRAVKYRS